MTKPTPGPWTAVPSARGGDYIETAGLNEHGEPRLIECPGSGGAMSYTSKICQLNWCGAPEWKANAALIAAAPDLLKALQGLVAERHGHQPGCPCPWCFARAAMAKATD
jgi:hypothetical protein